MPLRITFSHQIIRKYMISITRFVLLFFFYFMNFTVSVFASPNGDIKSYGFITLKTDVHNAYEPQVEVIEFFSYGCSHCSRLDNPLNDWIKKQGTNIKVRRVPVVFGDHMETQQRFYFTLQVLNKESFLRDIIFKEIHTKHVELGAYEEVLKFAVSNGIDKERFIAAYSSVQVRDLVKQADTMQRIYKIHSIPTIIVDGKFLINPDLFDQSPSPAGFWSRLFSFPTSERRSEVETQKNMMAMVDKLVAQQTLLRSKPGKI